MLVAHQTTEIHSEVYKLVSENSGMWCLYNKHDNNKLMATFEEDSALAKIFNLMAVTLLDDKTL